MQLDFVEVGQGCGVRVDGLLQKPVEEHAAGFGVASVEAEGVFVEVVGQVLDGDVVVQGSGDPPFQQTGDKVNARQLGADIKTAMSPFIE